MVPKTPIDKLKSTVFNLVLIETGSWDERIFTNKHNLKAKKLESSEFMASLMT